ncbi:hypothetical protein [Wenxinia marina]|uniref:Uncharacterized protein n=1 Tax=Wenxinia marina DSM 24838 TaxID=1123501 RepID=A0A0D0Q6I0_9RHOB|nr:hypothetical protein [Wenxinia marina]KIQ68067.1 hypothetical protein Wenmar_03282 [Wenxinia marina DSM 24838]
MLNLLMRALSLSPVILFGLAALIGGAGVWAEMQVRDGNARRLAALNAGPPPIIDIAQYDAAVDGRPFEEVYLRVQLDFALDYELTLERRRGPDLHAYMIPIYGERAMAGDAPLGVLFYDRPGQAPDEVDPLTLFEEAKGIGAIGPVLAINGDDRGLGRWSGIVADALRDHGLQLPPDAVILRPFDGGRAAGLAPTPLWVTGMLFWAVAAFFVLFAVARIVIGRSVRAEQGGTVRPATPAVAPAEAIRRPTYYEVPQSQEAPVAEWQRRLAAKTRAGTIGANRLVPGGGADDVSRDRRLFRRASPRARMPQGGMRVSSILVAALFGMFVLIAVAGSMSSGEGVKGAITVSFTEAIAELPIEGQQRFVAAGVATYADLAQASARAAAEERLDTVLIDLTPVAAWLLTKGWAAYTGDAMALLQLAVAVGAPFAALFVALIYVRLRRAFTPKVTGRIGSMGIN